MKEFTLKVFCTIMGIGATSGIHYDGDAIFLISDNASKLYRFNKKLDILSFANIYDSQITENIPKKEKADFEALAYADGEYHVFGSGSTDKRNKAFRLSEHPDSSVKVDLTGIYAAMRKVSGLSADNFNIEGAVKTKDNWYFFQRGNGTTAVNGIFQTDASLNDTNNIRFIKVDLPKINGFASGFTDAVMVDGDCWFLASAEDSASTYEDGAVAGSAIGKVNLQTGNVTEFIIVSQKNKFEGLTHFKTTGKEVSFLLCEDNDSDVLQTIIYKLTVQL